MEPPAGMDNFNTVPDSHRQECDLDLNVGDADKNITGDHHTVWKTPGYEAVSEISNSVASLTTSTFDSRPDYNVERTNLYSSKWQSENVGVSLDHTFNSNEEAVRKAGFTLDQHGKVSRSTPWDIRGQTAGFEGSSANVLYSQEKPPSVKQHVGLNSMDGSRCNLTNCSICCQTSVEGELTLERRLMGAIDHDDAATIRHLLCVDKLDPNFTVNMKNPICHATTLGNIHIMKLLLDAGARPDTPNASDLLWERHPIHIAASRGHMDAMRLLVKNGALVNQPDRDMRTPLHWAAMYGQADMVTWLLDAGGAINNTQTDGFTPLHTATCLGNREVCRLLIDRGADLFYKDCDGWTPLHTSVCYGYLDIVTLLLEKGACPRVTTGMNEDTTLHLACTKGRWDIAELMLKKGVPIESRNTYGFTPLLTAVFYNRVDLALQLVKKGADVNAVNHAGTSSIYLSAVRCELDLMKLLLLAGCKVPRHLSALSLPISQHSQTLAAEMEYRSRSPQRLRDRCLVVTRQSLAPDLQTKALLLPLPEVIKRELVMNNVSTTVVSLFL